MSLFQTQTLQTLKRLTLILLTLLLAIAIVAYIWLWQYNNRISHPLPIQNQSLPIAGSLQNAAVSNLSQLHIVATPIFKEPLSQVLSIFATRYPTIQTDITYLPAHDIASFVHANNEVDIVMADVPTLQNFQAKTGAMTTQSVNNHSATFTVALVTDMSQSEFKDMKESQLESLPKLKGFILADAVDNANVISLRNFLLASATQRYFNTDNTISIEPYQNRVDDLFNPQGNPPADTPAEKLSILNAIDSERERENEAVELVQ